MPERILAILYAASMLLLVLAVLVALVFPWIVAARRKHPDSLAILLISLLAGTTGLGWTAMMVWALSPLRRGVDDGLIDAHVSAMTRLKALLDSGALTPAEFAELTAKYRLAA